ncbi:MAG: hypothetical protein GX271_11855, partial [Clostridiales bacterium]|nr:hypothetical protein [Clostridiales bacterium]
MKLNRLKPKILFTIDAFSVFITSYIIYYWMPSGSQNHENRLDIMVFLSHVFVILISIILCQLIIKTHKIIWKYAEYNDYLKLMIGVIGGFLLYIIANYFLFTSKTSLIFSVCSCAVSILLMLLMRFFYRRYRIYLFNMSRNKLPLAIIGAGSAGVLLFNEILYNKKTNYSVSYFIDDDIDKIGKRIRNVMVYGPVNRFNEII